MIGRHRALVLDGKRSEADAEVDKWLANNPKEIPTRAYLAEQGLQHQQFAKAAGYYETLTRLQPNNPLLLNNLAWCYLQLKDKRAQEAVDQALSLQPDNAALLDTSAMILLDAGQVNKALSNLLRAVEFDKNNREIRLHLAEAYLKAGQKTKARQELEKLAVYGDQSDIASRARKLLDSVQ
jgi:predicted Zn-dependent protease